MFDVDYDYEDIVYEEEYIPSESPIGSLPEDMNDSNAYDPQYMTDADAYTVNPEDMTDANAYDYLNDSEYQKFTQYGSDAASDVGTYLKTGVTSGARSIIDALTSNKNSIPRGNSLFTIGKPVGFNNIIDPQKRLSSYIRTKMSVIDLIPCEYSMDFTKMQETAKGQNPVGGGLYKISYDKNIKIYQKLQNYYGLNISDTKSGIRLYTTDDTTAIDSFNIQYKPSIFQGPVDSLGELTRNIREIGSSVFSNFEPSMRDLASKGGGFITGGLNKVSPNTGGYNKAFGEIVQSTLEILVKGNRVSFPKIWQNTSHQSTISTVIKLVSPYGSPKAIYEFIIKPLTYLILLAAPQTTDGFSYGGAMPLTIKAYGMNYTVLGSINNITCRRGGSDTSFNVYRQPLSIDVSVDFQTLFDGFAAYLPTDNRVSTEEISAASDQILMGRREPEVELYQKTATSPLMTVGKYLESLKPIKIVDGNFQVYGNMKKPVRVNAPGTGSLGDLNQALGNIQSGLGVGFDVFGKVIGDMPGMSSLAEFTTAKESVTENVSSVVDWMQISTQATSTADAFRNKVTSNFQTFW